MPATSQAQFRAMQAAAHGDSTLGIPQPVGKEYADATSDPKALPKKVHPRRRGKRGSGKGKQMDHSHALNRLRQAHDAVTRGDVPQGMHHIGHALNHLRQSARAAVAQPDPDGDDDMPSSGNFIQGAIKHPGALHKELGVPQGQTIPAKKVEAAAHSENPTLARRARLAETLKKLHK